MLSAETAELQDGIADDERASAALGEEIAGVEEQLHRAREASVEAASAYQESLTAASLEEHRTHLVQGRPCPLCGSREHPWAEGQAPDAGDTDRLRAAAADREATVDSLVEQLTVARTRLENKQESIQQSTRRIAEIQDRASQPRERWSDLRQELSEIGAVPPVDPVEPAAATTVEALRDRSASELEEVSRNEERIEVLKSRVDERRAAVEEARQRAEGASRELQRVTEASRDLEREVAALRRDLDSRREEADQILLRLAPAFDDWPDWRDLLAADLDGFVELCGRKVSEWKERERQSTEGIQRLAEIEPAIEAARATAREKRGTAEAKRREHDTLRTQRAELEQERAELLEGRPTAEVEQRLAEALKSARRQVEEAASAASEAENRTVSSRAGVESTQRQMAALADRTETIRGRLGQELEQRELSLERLRDLLARDEAWLRDESARIEELRATLSRSETVLAERLRARDEHLGQDRPELERDELCKVIENTTAERAAAEEKLYEVRNSLDHDRRERERQAQLAPQLESQRAKSEVWAGLAELIGSHDGKKFREYAQSLTLETLVVQANEHLESLAPRYRLERIPSARMELQIVDRYMGDEIRSVNTLSGGESFLVSLALALGLSAVSSRATAVESLFIDEGFGSLDPESLEIALSTLDSLQASGRQVGIISHVQGLAERVGARIEVVPEASGKSRVRMHGPRASL